MRVLLAFDKFKDALSADAACEAAASALRSKYPGWTLDLCPLTDGGEGFAEILCRDLGERLEHIEVRGPREGRITAPVGFVSAFAQPPAARRRLGITGTIAVVGLASASGLELVPRDRRDPWHTTTYGTGELLGYAAAQGADAILLGLGGSATNDLGLGALAALGFKFAGIPTPATWAGVTRLENTKRKLPPIFLACDVANPLLGPCGATATFGPQKGLNPADLARLEAEMARMAKLLCEACGRPLSLADTPGAGAAGGIAFGLMIACGAQLVPGIDLVSDWLDLPARLAAADLVITGEGRFDASSLGGKGPGSLVREARRLGKPAHVFAGSLGVAPDGSHHAITPPGLPLVEALRSTASLLAAAVAREF